MIAHEMHLPCQCLIWFWFNFYNEHGKKKHKIPTLDTISPQQIYLCCYCRIAWELCFHGTAVAIFICCFPSTILVYIKRYQKECLIFIGSHVSDCIFFLLYIKLLSHWPIVKSWLHIKFICLSKKINGRISNKNSFIGKIYKP